MPEQEQHVRQPETTVEHPADTVKKSSDYRALVDLARAVKKEKDSLTPDQLRRYEQAASSFGTDVKARLDALANGDDPKAVEAAVRTVLVSLERLHAERTDTPEFRKKHDIPTGAKLAFPATVELSGMKRKTFRQILVESLLDIQSLGYDHVDNRITNVVAYDDGRFVVVEGVAANAAMREKMEDYSQRFVRMIFASDSLEWGQENTVGRTMEDALKRSSQVHPFGDIQIRSVNIDEQGRAVIAYAVRPEKTGVVINEEDLKAVLALMIQKLRKDAKDGDLIKKCDTSSLSVKKVEPRPSEPTSVAIDIRLVSP